METLPENFIRAIRTALESSDRETAQQLSIQAVKHYPQHEEILKYARILAPPKVTLERRLPDRDLEVNQNWIKQNRIQYRGQWVALQHGKLLASASSIDRLVEQLSDKKDIFLTAIY